MYNDIKINNKNVTQITKFMLGHLRGYKKRALKQVCAIKGCILNVVGYEISWGTDIKIATAIFNLSNALDRMCANLLIKPESRRYSVTWKEFEEGKILEAINEIKELAAIPLEGDLTLSQILNGYKNYTGHVVSSRHYEDPALIAAWADRPEVAREWLEWGLEGMRAKYGDHKINKGDDLMTVDEWYIQMQKRIADPEQIRQNVEDQIIHHKLTKVPRYDIIIDI